MFLSEISGIKLILVVFFPLSSVIPFERPFSSVLRSQRSFHAYHVSLTRNHGSGFAHSIFLDNTFDLHRAPRDDHGCRAETALDKDQIGL